MSTPAILLAGFSFFLATPQAPPAESAGTPEALLVHIDRGHPGAVGDQELHRPEPDAAATARDQHPPTGQKRDAEAPRFPKQRFEHVARAVAVGEKLAAGFFVNVHAELAEKCDRLVHRERAQYTTDDGRSSSPEIVLGDDGVGNVAARSAADENLGARFFRALANEDRVVGGEPSRENCGCQAGGAGADDDDVRRSTHAVIQSSSGTPRRPSQRGH